MVGTTGFGQPLLQARAGAGSNDSGDQPDSETDRSGSGPTIAAEPIPAWERVSIGLDRAWERARAAIRELESTLAAPEAARTSTPSRGSSGPRPGPAERTPGSSGTVKDFEPGRSGPAGESHRTSRLAASAIDAVLASWEPRRPADGRSVELGPQEQDRRVEEGPPRRPQALMILAGWTATAGASWGWKTVARRRHRRRPVMMAFP
jgi:hypothetical protein